LREILLAKFGREFAPKIRIAKFGSAMIGEMHGLNLDSLRARFRQTMNIPDDRVIVCIGHNGFDENQHLDVLKAMSRLPHPVLRRFVIVLPMTYGPSSDYVRQVKESSRAFEPDVRMIEGFQDKNAILGLRAASDIMVHVPVSDALSAALLETIYAGNVAITGAWLPYGELRRRTVHFREVSSFSELPLALIAAVENLPQERERVTATKERIREVADYDIIINNWLAVYEEALCLK
jgi:glycosyltransferase involved in cell wall biosynthesis